LDLLSCVAVAAALVRQVLHVDSIDPAAVRHCCVPWLLDPFSCLFLLVPALFVLLFARFLPVMSFWSGLLLLLRLIALVTLCLLLAWDVVAWALSR
jgi:hypothetical protein